MEKISNFTKNIVQAYVNEKNKMQDNLRNKSRIEIPAALSLELFKQGEIQKAEKLLDIIIKEQDSQGYWLEYSYEKDEEEVGYYGAIPTTFCIFALIEGYSKTKDKKYLISAIKGCDYLYSVEKNGYFLKASINKADVINTNLMCALALIETSKAMNKKSRRNEIYISAAARTIRRSINSQHLNGAYPYTSYGLT